MIPTQKQFYPSLHCLPMRPGKLFTIKDQIFSPCLSTSATISSSSQNMCLLTAQWQITGVVPRWVNSWESTHLPALKTLHQSDKTVRPRAKADNTSSVHERVQVVTVGVVGGSDLSKKTEQLGKRVINEYDFVFSENGLVAHKEGKLIGTQSMKSFLGEDKLKEFINFTLHYIADLGIPIKRGGIPFRGTFIDFRNGMLNVSPIGWNCSQEERDEIEKYYEVHNIRPKMVSILREKFAHLNLMFSIGGQISFDVFPQGWDKTYCLRFLNEFSEIHFFGDKTYKGGNDYEIYESERTVGHTVTSPVDTVEECRVLFLS